MSRSLLRALRSLFLPGGLLLAAAVVFLHWAGAATVEMVARGYPYAVYAVAMLLGWRFNRSRVVFAALVLALATLALHRAPPVAGQPASAGPMAHFIFAVVAFLLPANLAGFSVLSDRGRVWGHWAWGTGVLAAQVLIGAWVGYLAPESAARLLEHPLFATWLSDWTPVGQPALALFLLAAVLFVVRSLVERGAVNHGFLWALLAAFLALNTMGGPATVTVYLATGGLILAVAVVESSFQLAYRDELTGLPARRALNEELGRLREDYVVAMVDVDYFKKFNDTYGHDVGDQVLRMVGSRLREVGSGGKAFRYGGEEFTVLFPGLDVDDALPHLDAVRKRIEASEFTLRSQERRRKRPKKGRGGGGSRDKVSVTVSIGAAGPTRRLTTPEKVLQAADRALYRAKEAGRNRVRT